MALEPMQIPGNDDDGVRLNGGATQDPGASLGGSAVDPKDSKKAAQSQGAAELGTETKTTIPEVGQSSGSRAQTTGTEQRPRPGIGGTRRPPAKKRKAAPAAEESPLTCSQWAITRLRPK
ncbi:hypothetical protein E2562_024644 [Oryza meyeriana var. granulata]|uniref:Uncharacterized protein n=1 Tax=Oryza meyeriana var. granulata TaxID=110450 RepID=A0A6G1EBN2_9ORYZ|nr:hypothetical protein E2562_024644 [Oryza meyeriana var. granulata]